MGLPYDVLYSTSIMQYHTYYMGPLYTYLSGGPHKINWAPLHTHVGAPQRNMWGPQVIWGGGGGGKGGGGGGGA